MRWFPPTVALGALLLIACGDSDSDDSEHGEESHHQHDAAAPDAGSDAAASVGNLDAGSLIDAALLRDGASPRAGDSSTRVGLDGALLREVPCIDQQIAQLMLFDKPASGSITEEGATPGVFDSHIDTTAGGLSATESFVYARFTANGLEKVAVGDEDAFDSRAWHIAFRRYVVRINSGSAGPGDVSAARTAPMTDFQALASAASDLLYRQEQYYTPSCEFVPDTSGIGAPSTALSSFWSYAGCLAMTGNVFVLKLPEGRHVKLQVRAYYPPENQQRCNQTNTISQPSGAGNLRVRWAFLD